MLIYIKNYAMSRIFLHNGFIPHQSEIYFGNVSYTSIQINFLLLYFLILLACFKRARSVNNWYIRVIQHSGYSE